MSVALTAEHLVAHRGWRNCYPENTLLAVERAIAAGGRHIEIDIQFSGDGEAVVFHDTNLLRMCGADRDLYSLTLAELTQFTVSCAQRLGSHATDTHISSLQDIATLVAAHPGVTLYAEIKNDIFQHFSRSRALEVVCQALAQVQSQSVLISYDYAILHSAAALGWRVGPVLCDWQDLQQPTRFPAEAECLFLDYNQVPEGFDLRTLPIACVVYEIGTRDAALDWLTRGASKVETYCIGEMLGHGCNSKISNA